MARITYLTGIEFGAGSLATLGQTLKELGEDGVGMAISQVVPMPNSSSTPVVREFQAAWKALGVPQEPSHLALEGFINAKAFALAMQRVGRNASREAFIDSTWRMDRQDLGGFDLRFTAPGANDQPLLSGGASPASSSRPSVDLAM